MILEAQRKLVIEYCQKMKAEKLTDGTSGNISILDKESGYIAISPSALPYEALRPEDIPIVNLKGNIVDGNTKPSSELEFHLALYNKRDDIGAVVHTHSHYASAVACLGLELPPVHYMIGFAGDKVPLAPYKTFGTKELSAAIQENIGNYNALLLENHGLLAVHKSIELAYACAEAVEYVAKVFILAKSVGEPKILSNEEMAIVVEKFKHYK